MKTATRPGLALCMLLAAPLASADLLRQMPRDGELSSGEVVLVDDGRCPRGEVKEVRGGNKAKNVPCEVRCVPKPS